MPRFPFLDLATVNAPFLPELQQALWRVGSSGRYVGGVEVESFERELAQMTGTRHAVGVSNGLDALRLILRGYVAMGAIPAGGEVIAPANTYVATILAITDAGLRPVLVDPDPSTMNLPLEGLERYITPRTAAVMNVHLYGRVNHSESLERVCRERGLKLIEDNAQAIGARWHGRMTGSLGDAAAFSFYPTKNIGALGDAGAVTTDDTHLAATVRALANYGSSRRYVNLYQGFNCRLDPLQAAVLRVKLPFADRENELRRAVAEVYLSQIHNPLIRLPQAPSEPGEHVWHQFVVQSPEREALTAFLDANGIGWDIHYPTPPHLQPCYRGLAAAGTLPEAERLSQECVSLPISGRCTTTADARAIATLLRRFRP